MSDFLSAYSIQSWLESCPQGYLLDTQYGHAPGENESAVLFENPTDLASASPQELEAVLADTVLKEFKVRLDRIGIEYQTPAAP